MQPLGGGASLGETSTYGTGMSTFMAHRGMVRTDPLEILHSITQGPCPLGLMLAAAVFLFINIHKVEWLVAMEGGPGLVPEHGLVQGQGPPGAGLPLAHLSPAHQAWLECLPTYTTSNTPQVVAVPHEGALQHTITHFQDNRLCTKLEP